MRICIFVSSSLCTTSRVDRAAQMLRSMAATILGMGILASFLAPCVLAQPMPAVPLWPYPVQFQSGGTSVTVATTIGIEFVNTSSAVQPQLLAAFERFKSSAFADEEGASNTGLTKLVVTVQSDQDLQLGVDESYYLEIPVAGDIKLIAATVYGAYHGLTSLTQLIQFDYDALDFYITHAPWFIKDSPRYSHRELLIDTSRHFEPIPAIKHIIDSMTMAKLNVLHWHIVDIQSFPAASRVHPELAQKGAYGPSQRYTWAQMKGVVEYARARGIRVVPEFDVPAHTDSWYHSHPELFPAGCKQALDPANENVYNFYQELLKDWSEIFTDKVLHLGTDELPKACWNNSGDIAFMKKQGLQSLDDLFGYFVKRVVEIAEGLGKEACVWDESIIRTNLTPATAQIQIWHGDPGLRQKALSAGHNVIYSPNTVWYLDWLQTPWETMYEVEPELPTPIGTGRILGGGGEMWGETVDPSDLESTVWPRLAAIAERLWSPKEATVGAEGARQRLLLFRCWLLQHGVRTNVVGGRGRAPPPGPGACWQEGTTTTTSHVDAAQLEWTTYSKKDSGSHAEHNFRFVAAAGTLVVISIGVTACFAASMTIQIVRRRANEGLLLGQHGPASHDP